MRRVALFIAAFVAVAVGTGLVAEIPAHAAGDLDTVVLTNQEREANGLSALAIAPDLQIAAVRHAQEMANAGALWHTPNLATVVGNWRRLGENVGRGPSAAAIHAGFMGSPTHRANILLPQYSEIGVGSVTASDGRVYISVLYRQPMVRSVARRSAQAVVRLSTASAASPTDVQVAAADVSKDTPTTTGVGPHQLASGLLPPFDSSRGQAPTVLVFIAFAGLAMALFGHALRLRAKA